MKRKAILFVLSLAACSPMHSNSTDLGSADLATLSADFAVRDFASLPIDLSQPRCTPQPGLALCLSFEELDGSKTLDGSGQGNDGSPWPLHVTGKFGRGAGFDGSGTGIVVPNSASLDMKFTGTIEFWIKGIFPADDMKIQAVASRYDMVQGIGNDVLIVHGGIAALGGGVGYLNTNWNYVAMICTGSSAKGYLNGVAMNMNPKCSGLGELYGNLWIGRDASGVFPLKANLDEFKWWTVPRSEQQICEDGGGVWRGIDDCALP